jgi:hypothetical protein
MSPPMRSRRNVWTLVGSPFSPRAAADPGIPSWRTCVTTCQRCRDNVENHVTIIAQEKAPQVMASVGAGSLLGSRSVGIWLVLAKPRFCPSRAMSNWADARLGHSRTRHAVWKRCPHTMRRRSRAGASLLRCIETKRARREQLRATHTVQTLWVCRSATSAGQAESGTQKGSPPCPLEKTSTSNRIRASVAMMRRRA